MEIRIAPLQTSNTEMGVAHTVGQSIMLFLVHNFMKKLIIDRSPCTFEFPTFYYRVSHSETSETKWL